MWVSLRQGEIKKKDGIKMFGKKEDSGCVKKGIYVLYDKIARDSGPSFDAVNDGVALRHMIDMFLNQFKGRLDHQDYDLYEIAELYPSTREIKPSGRLIDIHVPINNKIQEKLLLEKDQGRLMFEESRK